jgi:isoleucyl-tRNA synthetase
MAYEGKKPVFWCPSCETALAGYEATDSYKNVTDPSIYIKFQLVLEPETSLLVYTTTPWTLPANCAVMVAPEELYVKVKTEKHGNLILAKERLVLLKQLDVQYTLIEEFKGKALDGKKYHSLIDVPSQHALQKNPNALRVFLSIPILKERVGSKVAAKKGLKTGDVFEDFVTVLEGTGLVHCAPGHGKSDNEIGKHYGIPEVSPLDDQCKFTAEVGPFQGQFVKSADHAIAELLHQTGRLLHYGTIEHSYPLCWRCKSPLIFRMSNQWFLKIDPIREQMLEANEKVNWQPDFAKERFANWVANADDWNFSRQRYWGVPIPIWKGKSGATYVIGSEEELRRLATKKLPANFDLHTVNDVSIKHPETGEEMHRIHDIFDVWYDSGSAPFASLGYPFHNKELFENHYPIDRINESQDQIRGWFYSLMFCNIATFGTAPYKTISMPGWVLDEKGDKMSKSVGNMIFAKDALEELGADVIRFYYCWEISPASTQKFNMETIKNDVRKLFSIWSNLVQLVKNSSVSFSEHIVPKTMEDSWLLSRLHRTIKEVRDNVESFELHLAGRSLQEFIMEDLSRTYVQLVRDRLDNEELPAQLISLSLWETSKLSAAITPFQSEIVYEELRPYFTGNKEASVHLEILPIPHIEIINDALEEEMTLASDLVSGILAARDKAVIGVRWPVAEITIDIAEEFTEKIDGISELIKRQTNVRTLKIAHFPVSYDAKPNYQTLGKTYGEKTGDAIVCLQEHKEAIITGVTTQGKITIGAFTYMPEHLNLQKIIPETHTHGACKQGSVYLLKAVPEELEIEGFAREITRRLQQLRKDAGLEKKDRISAAIIFPLADKLRPFKDEIAQKIGADHLSILTSSAVVFDHMSEATVKGKLLQVMLKKHA